MNADPSFETLLRLGTERLVAGRAAEAVEPLAAAHAQRPQDVDAALNLGGAYILLGSFQEARELLEPLSRRAPQNAQVWTNLGAAYLGNPLLSTPEMQQRAIDSFKRALELDPVARGVAYNIGLIYYRYVQDRERARFWLRRALLANPADRDAGNILARLDRDEEA